MMKKTLAFILLMTGTAGIAFVFTLLLLNTGAVLRSQPSFPDNGQLFADTVVPAVYLTINPDTLAWIYANPDSDREFRATFVFDNGAVRDTIDTVGFRLRGNTSRQSRKKSFKISFNTYTEGGKYQDVAGSIEEMEYPRTAGEPCQGSYKRHLLRPVCQR